LFEKTARFPGMGAMFRGIFGRASGAGQTGNRVRIGGWKPIINVQTGGRPIRSPHYKTLRLNRNQKLALNRARVRRKQRALQDQQAPQAPQAPADEAVQPLSTGKKVLKYGLPIGVIGGLGYMGYRGAQAPKEPVQYDQDPYGYTNQHHY
jgi:hypothetical protein